MDAITQALAAIERLKLLGPGAVTGRLPADPAYGPPRPSLGGYAADPGMTGLLAPPAPAPAPASGAGPTGLLSAPPSPGAAPPVGNPPPMLPPPQPISPMVGAPQPISPLVTGGKLPELPAGGMAQQGGKGFWDFLADPSVSRGLMEMGMRLMAASAPSTDPRSGSLGFGLSQGLGGFMKGQDDVKAEQRQAENDAINRLYKQATIDSMNAPEKPNIETFYDPATGRERKGWYDFATNQINWVGGSKAAPQGAGGGSGGGKWKLQTVNGVSSWVNDATQEIRPIAGGSPAAADGLAEVTKLREMLKDNPDLVGLRGTDLGAVANQVGSWFGGEDYGKQRELEMFITTRAMELAKNLKGNLSDKDVKFLKDTQPKLSDPPEVWDRWLSQFQQDYLGGGGAASSGGVAPPPGFVPVN